MSEELLRLIHLGATAFMTGLIWFVQVVHYPLFARVGREGFVDYERRHTRLTTFIVGPAMLLEATCAGLIFAHALRHAELDPFLPAFGVALLALIWFSTAFVQVPRHRELERGFDETAARRLVRSNWWRTIAWSARTIAAVGLVLEV
jgi:uncharacterized membrane protein